MNQSGLKNMVVLRNLPSNLIEEDIIVLKSNKNIKQIEKIDKNKIKELRKECKELGIILKTKETFDEINLLVGVKGQNIEQVEKDI